MTATIDDASDRPDDDARDAHRDELAGRLVGAVLAASSSRPSTSAIGSACTERSPTAARRPLRSSPQRAGIHSRYAREWLEQQAVGRRSSMSTTSTPRPTSGATRCRSATRRPDSIPRALARSAPLARFVVGTAATMPACSTPTARAAASTGRDYGAGRRRGAGGINRPQFHHLIGEWIGDLPDIAERLRRGTGRVADVACGTGWSSISIARDFPDVARRRHRYRRGFDRPGEGERRGSRGRLARVVPLRGRRDRRG